MNLDWERLVRKTQIGNDKRTVCQLKFALRFELVVERNNNAFGLLVHEHGMPMTERSSANVLTGNADITSFEQEGSECECLRNMSLSQTGEETEKDEERASAVAQSRPFPVSRLLRRFFTCRCSLE